MTVKELRNKNADELKEELKTLIKGVEDTTTEILKGKEKNFKKVRNLRKDIARVLTILKEQSLSEGKNA